jgi:plasmid stabilization system protein ParE
MKLEITEAAALAILEQMDYFRQAGDDALAERWEASVHRAVQSVLQMPLRGAPCRFRSPELAGVRWVPVQGFPKHMVFYRVDADDQLVLVIHVVHGARDLPAIVGENEGEDS